MLRKNVASQVVTFSLVNATSGAALTGATVTVKVTLDGTQSSGAGTVTELGTGQYKYVPTQAETNGNSVGFGFTATNAVPVNLHAFTTAADPTDATRFGLTALPNANAEASGGLATLSAAQASNGTINVNVHRWLTGTPNALQSGRVDAYIGAVASGVIAAASFAAGAFDAVWTVATRVLTAGTNIVLAKGVGVTGFNDLSAAQVNAEADTALADAGVTTTVTGRIDAAISSRLATAGYTAPLDAAGVRTAVGLASANLDTQLGDLPTNAELATALAGADDAVLAQIAALNNLSSAGAQAAAEAALAAYGAALQATLTTAAGYIDTEVAAIKAKTDNLPAAPAATGDIPTAAQIADKVLGRNIAGGSDGGRTVTSALRTMRNKVVIDGSTITVYEEDDVTVAYTGTVTRADLDALTGIDPA